MEENIRVLENEKTVLEQRLEESQVNSAGQRRQGANRRMHSNSDLTKARRPTASVVSAVAIEASGQPRSFGAVVADGSLVRWNLQFKRSGQVAMRLRQAAHLNEELQARMLRCGGRGEAREEAVGGSQH